MDTGSAGVGDRARSDGHLMTGVKLLSFSAFGKAVRGARGAALRHRLPVPDQRVGCGVPFVYFMICISELRLRRPWEREEPGILQFRMWFYPVLPMLVTAAIVAVLVSMGLRENNRIELLQCIAVRVVLTVIYFVESKTRKWVSTTLRGGAVPQLVPS